MLQIAELHYRYGARPVLAGVGLSVAAGQIVSLVGPNGAGKSTLLKCINRILPAPHGQLLLQGRPIDQYRRLELARAISYVPQHGGTLLPLQVLDMIEVGRAPHRRLRGGARDRQIVRDVVQCLGLEPLAFRFVGELSGGERQRALIARALVQEAQLMLLDEPTVGLDLHHQLEVMSIVRAVTQERGVAALITMHDLALAARFSDRLVMLHQGRVHAQGPWREVLSADNLRAVYGVTAVVGTDQGLPYVVPQEAEPS
jgi:iron complex transport system ATP-binding protein